MIVKEFVHESGEAVPVPATTEGDIVAVPTFTTPVEIQPLDAVIITV